MQTCGRGVDSAKNRFLDCIVIQLKSHGFRWELSPDFAPMLGPVLAVPVRTIKESPVKLVAVHEIEGRKFYVKRYRHHAVPLRPAKYFFRTSQGRSEWALAKKMETLGAPIVRHVGHGERWSWSGLQESIVITEGFAGVPLNEVKGLDWQRVPEFLQRLHALGVLQRDLNPGNVLVRLDPPEFRLVDLHGIVVKPALTAAEREDNLATLAMSLPIPVTAAVARRSEELRRQYAARYARRCLFHNREFAPRKIGRIRWHVRLPFQSAALQKILEAPDGFLRAEAKLFKTSRSTTVGSGDGLVLKRYNFRKIRNLFIDLVRPSRARRAFRKAYHLELAGIATPRPIAAGDLRVCRVLLRCYMVMEEIPGAVELNLWRPEAGRVVGKVARMIAKMHNEGFRHRDLKETNILLDLAGNPYLIDLEGLRYVGTVRPDQVLFDLGRLARGAKSLSQFTRADRETFIRVYCKARGLRPRAFFSTLP